MKKALEIEEEIQRKRLESYNKKISKYSQREKDNSLNKKEMIKKEQLKQEQNAKAVLSRRQSCEEKQEQEKKKCLDRIAKKSEKYILNKEKKDKEMKVKFNKMYILAKNVNEDYKRNNAINVYQRKEKMEQINKKMNKIDRILQERHFHNEERIQLEEQLSEEKLNMQNRLAQFLHSDKNYSKEEVYKFVFDGKKPNNRGRKKSGKSNKNENEDENGEENFDENAENFENEKNNEDKYKEKENLEENKQQNEKNEEKKEIKKKIWKKKNKMKR